ncbi:hypothetical protein BHE74_00043854 [Ensete ventricosum]|nr:hypothetical protein BHE74_00043854 [Ensete ventricosum]
MPSDACYVVIGTLTHDSNPHQTEPARKLKPKGLVSLSLLLGIGAEQGGPPRSRVGRGFPGDAKRKDMAKRELSSTLKNLKATSAATDSRTGSSKNVSDLDLKRKEPESETDKTTPRKLPKTPAEVGGGQSWISNDRRASHKQQKHEKLDWNVLRPPKPGNRG